MSKEKTAADHGNTLTAKEITKKTPQLDSVKLPAVDPVKRFADKIHETFDPIKQSIAKLETRQQELNKQIADTEGTYDVKEIHERTVAKSELGEVNTALENAQAEYEKTQADHEDELADLYDEILKSMEKPLRDAASSYDEQAAELEGQVTDIRNRQKAEYTDGIHRIKEALYDPFRKYFPQNSWGEPSAIHVPEVPMGMFNYSSPVIVKHDSAPTGPVDPWGKPRNH